MQYNMKIHIDMLRLIKALSGERTILMVSHVSEVIRHADVVFTMADGGII